MPFLPIVAAGVTAAVGVKNLASGGGGGAVSGMPDPAAGFEKPINQTQVNSSYQKSASSVDDQKKLVDAINAQNGLQHQTDVYNQLQGVAEGTGPNPAQAQLANATRANVANQAALMASQRGTSANAGLLARQAAMRGGDIQQQAAGQGAALQAQQSLNAINAAGNIAGQQAGQQIQGQNNTNQAALGFQSNILNAASNYNNTVAGGQNNANTNNTQMGINQSNQNAQQLGNVLNAAGTIAGKLDSSSPSSSGGGGGSSFAGQGPAMTMAAQAKGGFAGDGPKSKVGKHIKGMSDVGEAMKQGGRVPGKPNVGGAINTQKNDNVAARLSPGEIVLPRSVTKSEDPSGEAAKFVSAIMARSNSRRK